MVELLYELHDFSLKVGNKLRPTADEGRERVSWLVDNGRVIVADVGGRIVGTVCGVPAAMFWSPSKTCLTEVALYVRPDMRGTRIGSKLIEAWTLAGSSFDCQTITVSDPGLVPTIQKMGYAPMETTLIRIN